MDLARNALDTATEGVVESFRPRRPTTQLFCVTLYDRGIRTFPPFFSAFGDGPRRHRPASARNSPEPRVPKAIADREAGEDTACLRRAHLKAELMGLA